MAAHPGQFMEIVREGRLDERGLETRLFGAHLPDAPGFRCISAVEKRRIPFTDNKASGGNGVVDTDRYHLQEVNGEPFLFVQWVVRQGSRLQRGQPGKVGEDDVVEDVPAQVVQDFRERMHLDWSFRAATDQVIGEKRQALDVVEVRMREQDAANLALFRFPQTRTDRPRIQHARLVDEKPARSAFADAAFLLVDRQFGAVTSEDLNDHRRSPNLLLADVIQLLSRRLGPLLIKLFQNVFDSWIFLHDLE